MANEVGLPSQASLPPRDENDLTAHHRPVCFRLERTRSLDFCCPWDAQHCILLIWLDDSFI